MTTISVNKQINETIVLDEFGESVEIQNGGSVQTGDLPGVVAQASLNQVSVAETGLIESAQTAVQIDGDGANILNQGTISGGFNGINIANGDTASARITNEGTLSSDSRPVNIGGQGGVLDNFGEILSTADPRNGTVYGDVTAQNIVINNRATGLIDVGAGNNGDAISLELGRASGSVRNEGFVQGRGLPGVANPDNQAAALRLYTPEGQEPGRFIGDIDNSGTLAAENGPAVILEENTTVRGDINNSGLIESANPENGIGVLFEDGSNFRGTLFNSGTINGGLDGVNFGNGGTARGRLVNQEGGMITSSSRAVNIGGDRNRIENHGLITNSADPRNGTVYADQSTNNFRIINSASGIIDVGTGLNGDAISLQLGANVTGTVVNRGLVQGRGVADGPQNNATNQATALRLYHGDNAGEVSVFNGNIRNLGAGILASENDHAILVESQVRLNGHLVNAGQIISEGEDAIRLDGDVTGSLTNRGIIAAENDGIEIDGRFEGDVNNRGTIVSETGHGIKINGKLTGTINNSGFIQGAQNTEADSFFGIDGQNAGNGLTVNNTGRIDDDVRLSQFDDVFDGAGGTVDGEVLGLGGNDQLIGGRLQDTLNGGDGDDILNGGQNRDVLTGGAGTDIFVLESNYGNDIITDFLNGTDLLDTSALGLSIGQAQSALEQAQQVGHDTLISFQAGNTLRLQNFQSADLDVSDLVLV